MNAGAQRGLAFCGEEPAADEPRTWRAPSRAWPTRLSNATTSSQTISFIGLQTGGEPFARRLAQFLGEIAGEVPPVGLLDVSFYRDDLILQPRAAFVAHDCIDHDLTDRTVVLVDDVLFTGRTIRAALNALTDWGRPRSVQLAVMVDRGHRELPIRPDFVGKNLPTSRDEAIEATLDGVWIGTRKS